MKSFVVKFVDSRSDVPMTFQANTEEEAAQLFVNANMHLTRGEAEIHVFVNEEGTNEKFDIGLTRKPEELSLSFGFYCSITEQLQAQFPGKVFPKEALERLDGVQHAINILRVGSYINASAVLKARKLLMKEVKELVQSS